MHPWRKGCCDESRVLTGGRLWLREGCDERKGVVDGRLLLKRGCGGRKGVSRLGSENNNNNNNNNKRVPGAERRGIEQRRF